MACTWASLSLCHFPSTTSYFRSSLYELVPEAYFVREALEGGASGRAFLGGLEAPDDVLECGCHYEVLLLQTKFFPLKELQHRVTEKQDKCDARHNNMYQTIPRRRRCSFVIDKKKCSHITVSTNACTPWAEILNTELTLSLGYSTREIFSARFLSRTAWM